LIAQTPPPFRIPVLKTDESKGLGSGTTVSFSKEWYFLWFPPKPLHCFPCSPANRRQSWPIVLRWVLGTLRPPGFFAIPRSLYLGSESSPERIFFGPGVVFAPASVFSLALPSPRTLSLPFVVADPSIRAVGLPILHPTSIMPAPARSESGSDVSGSVSPAFLDTGGSSCSLALQFLPNGSTIYRLRRLVGERQMDCCCFRLLYPTVPLLEELFT